MNTALRKLGFKVHDMQSCFNSRNEPLAWSRIIRGRQHYDPKLLANYDAAVGIPTSSCWERIFTASPEFTKVILVIEENKPRWANVVLKENLPIINELEKVGARTSVGRDWMAFFINMYPREVITPHDPSSSYAKFNSPEESKAKQMAQRARETESFAAFVAEREKELANAAEDLSRQVRESGGNPEALKDYVPKSTATSAAAEMNPLGSSASSDPSILGGRVEAVGAATPVGAFHEDMIHASTTSKPVSEMTDEEIMIDIMIKGLTQFECNVKDVVPANRLLVYKKSEGWGPLCTFLELPTPIARNEDGDIIQMPFPDDDDGTEALKRFHVRLRRAGHLSRFTVVFAILFFGFNLFPFVIAQWSKVPSFFAELKTDFEGAYGTKIDSYLPIKFKDPRSSSVG
jgi:hypothetical protein